MSTPNQRYVFTDFENLKKVKFKKLKKIADKLFIIIGSKEICIPARLVFQMQKLGKNVKWVKVENVPGGDLNYNISFLIGKLHQKINMDIEFGLLSNDPSFDALINFINKSGRYCLRIKRKRTKNEKKGNKQKKHTKEPVFNGSTEELLLKTPNPPISRDPIVQKRIIGKTARKTIQRLKRSKNRPTEIAALKTFILLNNRDPSLRKNLDEVIHQIENSKKINIHQGEISYDF